MMQGIFRTAFGTFALLASIAHAIPNPSNIDIIVQIDENVPASMDKISNQEISMIREQPHATEEFSCILMFDEIITDGNYMWPDGYGNLEWSTNHYIFNQSEQRLFSRNQATSPPNLLYVQDASHSGGAEPYFKVRTNSPAQSFDLHRLSILPYTATPKAPILLAIRGHPANGGNPIIEWFKWSLDSELQGPGQVILKGMKSVKKVEILVVPGNNFSSKERLPCTVDDIKITWRNPPIPAEREDIVVVQSVKNPQKDL